MIRQAHSLSRVRPGLLAVLAVVLLAGSAPAENLSIRNELKVPVVVQVSSVFRGALFRSRPYLLKTGARTPTLKVYGEKFVTVYDGKVPNRVLFQGPLKADPTTTNFQILPGLPGGAPVRVMAKERSMR